MASELLTRTFSADLELRGDDGRTVVGIAAPFGEVIDLGRYREVLRHGAFARTIAERGAASVKFLAVHNDRQLPLGRATLLREDTSGLYAELRVSKTQAGDEALELIRDGALDGLSIGFNSVPATDRWNQDRTHVERTEVRLHEISAVPFPAYPSARVAAVRSHVIPLDPAVGLGLMRRRLDLIARTTS